MKRFLLVLGMALVLTVTAAGSCLAASDYDYDTFPDWEIQVAVPEGATGVLEGSDYYVYTADGEGIPYVMLHVYGGYEDEITFIGEFTDYMKEAYADLEVLEDAAIVRIDGANFYEIDYTYKVSGYDVLDRRVVKIINGLTYMFASKEVEELGLVLDGMLEEVVSESIFLEDGEPIDISDPEPEDNGDLEEIWWEDIAEDVDVEGEFYTFEEAGFEMYIPDFLHATSLPDEQSGYIAYFMNDEMTRALSVQYVYIGISRDEYYEILEGLDQVTLGPEGYVNGQLVKVYTMESVDTGCISYVLDNGYVLEFAFAPLSDEDYAGIIEEVMMSIRPVEENVSPFSAGK